MKNNVSIRFWLRKTRKGATGEAPIYYYIIVNKQRSDDYAVKLKIDPLDWDSKQQKSKTSDILNVILGKMKEKVMQSMLLAEMQDRFLSTYEVIGMLNGENTDKYKPIKLIQLVREYVDHEAKTQKKAAETIRTYKTRLVILLNYLQKTKKMELTADQVNVPWGESYCAFVQQNPIKKTRVKKTNGEEYSNKCVLLVKQACEYGEMIGKLVRNPLKGYDFKFKKGKNVTWLNVHERKTLMDFKFAAHRLNECRNIFMLMCLTGLDNSDVLQLDIKQQVKKDDDGTYWLIGNRVKTDVPYMIPLSVPVVKILQHYAGHSLTECDYLPVLTNQAFNRYLKEIASIVGFDKRLTTKVARKTFGMMMVNEYHIELNAVKGMMGHTTVKTTEAHYVDVLKGTIKEAALKYLSDQKAA